MEMGGSSNALDVSAPTQDMKFMLTSNVNVSDFVSVKLSGRNNYNIWKVQMLCLIKSQVLLNIIDAEHPFPRDKDVRMIAQYDELVKGWILGSVNENVLKDLVDEPLNSAREIWKKLESSFGPPISDIEGMIWQVQKENFILNSTNVIAPVTREELKYMQASNINVSNFVSVKFSGYNYSIWKAQMLCLIKSQDLHHIIDNRANVSDHMTAKYNNLVKGWIFSTTNIEFLGELVKLSMKEDSVSKLWKKLDCSFSSSPAKSHTEDAPGFMFGPESIIANIPEIEMDINRRLYSAAVNGFWWKAKSILKKNKNAATVAITLNGNTILHLAVEKGHNYFVEKLLEFLVNGEDIERKNFAGRTALHIAAEVGNTHATELLVQKRKQLLEIFDNHGELPFHIAKDNPMFINNIFKSVSFDVSFYPADLELSTSYIHARRYDLAWTLIEPYEYLPLQTKTSTGTRFFGAEILMAITENFPSGLGPIESFVYPSFHNVSLKTIMRDSLLFHSNFLDKSVNDILLVVKTYNNKCVSWLEKICMTLLVPVATLYQLIFLLILVLRLPFSFLYVPLWKVLAFIVPPIKNIEKKKKEIQEAKMVLSQVCKKIRITDNAYSQSIVEAVRKDAYEVVDEILYKSPSKINSKDEEGYNIIQLAVINRSVKVYNLIYHIINCMKTYRMMKDSYENNLVHLAGRLAPSFVLQRTTGAALQLQRELLWHEEVEKLLGPKLSKEKNLFGETSSMIFTKEHQDLMMQGECWMKKTAESCSITAALIVTIVFAAAITVPGGSIQESGIPVFKKEITFKVFGFANAFSLFTATTSLFLFLSILTTRFSERDFRDSLPKNLIWGILTLFLSTTSMIVAFGAILFLVFCDQRPWMLVPIFGFACLPITVIVTIKLPLLVDLVKSTYFPIFGEHSYLESCKFYRKNTIFM